MFSRTRIAMVALCALALVSFAQAPRVIDSVTPTYTGVDLFEQAVRAVEMGAKSVNATAAANYIQMADNAIQNYTQKGVKPVDPMPQPPKALTVEVTGRTISLVESADPVAAFRDYPDTKRVEGVAKVGPNMGDPDHPERHHIGAGDTMPLGAVVTHDGKRFRVCGRVSPFGGLVRWYEAL
jgi:hypothetical protein